MLYIREVFCYDLWCTNRAQYIATRLDELFEITTTNADGYEVTEKDPSKTYTRKMTYLDILFLPIWPLGKIEDCKHL